MRRLTKMLWLCSVLWLRPELGSSQAVVEGTVPLAPPANPPQVIARYSSQLMTPAPPEAPAAIIFLEGSFPAAGQTNPAPVVLGQKDLQFVPCLLAIQKGTAVE